MLRVYKDVVTGRWVAFCVFPAFRMTGDTVEEAIDGLFGMLKSYFLEKYKTIIIKKVDDDV